MPLDSTADVWRWREFTTIGSRIREKSQLRRQAIIQAVVTAAIGFLLNFVFGHHAYRCFRRTEMAVLVLSNLILHKDKQPAWQDRDEDWQKEFPLD